MCYAIEGCFISLLFIYVFYWIFFHRTIVPIRRSLLGTFFIGEGKSINKSVFLLQFFILFYLVLFIAAQRLPYSEGVTLLRGHEAIPSTATSLNHSTVNFS